MNVKTLKQALRTLRITPLGIWENDSPVIGLLPGYGKGGSGREILCMRVVVKSLCYTGSNPYKVKFIAFDHRQSMAVLLQRIQASERLSDLLLDEQALMALKPGRTLTVQTAVKHLKGQVEDFRLLKEENDPVRSNPDAA